MKDLKIAKKLILGFGFILVLLLVLTAVSFMNMNTIGTQVDNYADYTVPNNNHVWQMRRDMISIQRYLLIALTETDQNKTNEALANVDTEAARIRETLADYLITTRADKNQLTQLQNNITTMGPHRQKIEDLIKQNTAQSREQAYVVFQNDYKPILDANADILSGIGDFQNQRGEEQAVEAEHAFTGAIWQMVIVIIICIVITVCVTITITRSIVSPVKQLTRLSQGISDGDLDVSMDYESKDELGQLADNMRGTIHTLKEIIDDVDYLLESMGKGDFTKSSSCPERYVGQYKNILVATQQINRNLSNTLLQINQVSEQVSAGADQVSSGAQALSQGATEQASSIEELSATIEEISSQIKLTAENAMSAKNHSEKSSSEVENSNRQMQEMITAMNEINHKSSEISKIIKTIEDIAFQTNILALNAAVEAARAGSAGKGFAVVADEVRNLAGKSAEAAKSTTMLIEETVSAVDNGTQIANSTAAAMLGVVDATKEVSDLVVDIASASNEQANFIAQVTVGVDQISSVIQTNSATAEESAAASEELSGQATMLKEQVRQFKIHEVSTGGYIEKPVSRSERASEMPVYGDKY